MIDKHGEARRVTAWAVWVLAIVAVTLGGAAILARRRPSAPGGPPHQRPPRGRAGDDAIRSPRADRKAPAIGEPAGLAQLAADAEAVRAAAERAVTAADQARDRADQAAELRDQAEKRYLTAHWAAQAAAVEEPQRLVQRAALDAYRRGDLTVAQLNAIWRHTGSGEETLGDPGVRAALQAYRAAIAESAQASREAHVAEVAAKVLADEVRIAESDLLSAERQAHPRLDDLLSPERHARPCLEDLLSAERQARPGLDGLLSPER